MAHRKPGRRLVLPTAGLAAAALLLAACGSSSSTTPSESSSDTGAASSSSAASDQFQVNLNDCTDPAAPTQKVTDTWTIGYSAPLSGPVAGVVGLYFDGWKARIKAANDAGGINGVKIDVQYKDDAFTPDRAKTNATEFIQSDHVDSLITFGSGPVGAIADDQNAACVPLLYPSSSVAQYRDISQYPWTVQFLPNADLEAKYDVSLIQSKFPNGANVGIAENQTASGKGYSEAFQNAAKGTNVTVGTIAPSTDPNAAATALKAANPDVVYIAGITNDCGPDVQAMARVGFTPKLVIAPSNCADQTGWIAAGKAANGVIVPTWSKNPADPSLASDAGVKEYLSEVTTSDSGNTITIAGWIAADMTINTLQQAADSANGLTQESVIQAARNQNYPCPMFIDGITWLSTPTAMTGFSGFQTQVWNASKKMFDLEGNVIPIA
ncbi:MAG: ABC transporter substrate-binding protein [Frankiales bacterium]|nr:ABC transporter substrate-binding protein [Frankiales bacterium]